MIYRRLRFKKVLLILDDVNSFEQVEVLAGKPDWFGLNSRVIITTREKRLLAIHNVKRIYEVQPLNHKDALELVSHHIFKECNGDSSHTKMLDELVAYASGLPLALKVIGRELFGRSVRDWKSSLHWFKRIPPKEIQETLKTSFDLLMDDEKSAFLDIACCFQGYDLAEVLDILYADHGSYAQVFVNMLIDKSLIGSDVKVTLHPLIESMGKEIVRQEDPKEPGEHTRLWFTEDIVHVLKNNTGTSNIEIIHPDSPLIDDEEAIDWSGEAFKNMENLRTLIIKKCKFSKAPKYLPDSLRVLEWQRYPSEELNISRATLATCIIRGEPVNLGWVLANEICEFAKFKGSRIGWWRHASLISLLCEKAGVVAEADEDAVLPGSAITGGWIRTNSIPIQGQEPPIQGQEPQDEQPDDQGPTFNLDDFQEQTTLADFQRLEARMDVLALNQQTMAEEYRYGMRAIYRAICTSQSGGQLDPKADIFQAPPQ